MPNPDVQRLRERLVVLKRHAPMCRHEAEVRGPGWSGYEGQMSAAQDLERAAEDLQHRIDESWAGSDDG